MCSLVSGPVVWRKKIVDERTRKDYYCNGWFKVKADVHHVLE
jgi:hypothetical protein